MISILIICGLVATIWLAFVVTGITYDDLRHIRLERALRHHPFARRWRQRPTVSVVLREGGGSDAARRSLKNGSYRKYMVVQNRNEPHDAITLFLDADTTLPKTAIIDAVHRFAHSPNLTSVEIPPVIPLPATVRQLFRHYRLIALAPLASARTGLHIAIGDTPFPRLSRHAHTHGSVKYAYETFRLVVQACAIIALLGCLHAALVLYQSDFLLAYIGGFGLWLSWAIFRYPSLSLRARFFYFLAMPAALPYFTILTLSAPLRIGALGIIRRRRGAMMDI